MRCSQCPNSAFYVVGHPGEESPLCISCWSVVEDINFRKWLQHSAMANQAADDMDDITGFGPTGGRIPVTEIARAASKSRTYNNIRISNSNVGVINTGNLARIDAAITISKGTASEELGARLKDLTEAILGEASVAKEARQQMIEVVQAISDQAIGSNKPSEIVVTTLFEKLKRVALDFTTIVAAIDKLHAAWVNFHSAL